MKWPPVVFMLFTLLLLLSASIAYAGVSVSGIHRLVYAEPASGGSSLGFRIKVTNTGDDAFLSAHLVAKDPLVVPGSSGSEISIPGLAAGDSVTIDVSVLSSLPPDQLREGLEIPLNFDASITNASGSVSPFTLVSEGGTP